MHDRIIGQRCHAVGTAAEHRSRNNDYHPFNLMDQNCRLLAEGRLMPCARASYCEIYNEQVYDLLKFTKQPLPVKWDAHQGFHVAGLHLRETKTLPEMLQVNSVTKQFSKHVRGMIRPLLSVTAISAVSE